MFEYNKFSKLFLLSGEDLQLNDSVFVKHPKIEDILSINKYDCESLYQYYNYLVCSDPYSNMVYLYDNGLDYEKMTPFDVLMNRFSDFDKINELDKTSDEKDFDKNVLERLYEYQFMQQALNFYFYGCNWHIGKYDSCNFLISEDNKIINQDEFNLACGFIRQVNGLDSNDSERVFPANDFAKKMLIEIERDRILYAKKDEPIDFISKIVLESELPLLDIKKYSIFQVFELAKLNKNKMMVDNLLNGYYNGSVESNALTSESLDYTK